ncbi:MAG: tRNA (adenosine(37)-N6)-threonylcarbamoyltransferase complex ATPase subunit type 1 TsaE [Clostridiales bacterium]|jgi:tRNA threonylcarbamoyladenosine biosynthesis protein TsaE|nr:tRNA (adenosine(37)-N6)-threonylcarbamoyltransferase complex ATPase subunit type 1 TsaE [Clostridiales bacterium]
MKFVSDSTECTLKIAKSFSQSLEGGDIVSLVGDVGVGKTVFAKGVAIGLGVENTVVSPSFVLCCHYKGTNFNLVHIDAYRLQGQNLINLGFEEILQEQSNICLIEWAEYLDVKPKFTVKITQCEEYKRMIELINN